jgi:hypothetical protein
MGSTRSRMAGVAAFALLSTGLFALPVLAQQGGQHSQREGVANSKAGLQSLPMNNLGGEGRSRTAAGVATPGADLAAPVPNAPAAAVPAPSAGGSGSSNAPVSAPAGPSVTAAAPIAPPGLSQDAPDVPPSLGVVGARGPSSGPSPAATPEPSTLLLMGTGLVGLYRLRKRP